MKVQSEGHVETFPDQMKPGDDVFLILIILIIMNIRPEIQCTIYVDPIKCNNVVCIAINWYVVGDNTYLMNDHDT